MTADGGAVPLLLLRPGGGGRSQDQDTELAATADGGWLMPLFIVQYLVPSFGNILTLLGADGLGYYRIVLRCSYVIWLYHYFLRFYGVLNLQKHIKFHTRAVSTK